MSNLPKIIGPIDQRQNPIYRAMGLPVVLNTVFLGQSTEYAILYDFSDPKFSTRVFTGMSVENPDGASRIRLYAVDDLMDTPRLILDLGPSQFFTLDWLQFGPGIVDDTELLRTRYILGRLDVNLGTLASGTINYSVSLQPSDEDTININGLVYEFSADKSRNPSNDFVVDIGVDADATWTNFINKLNATQRYVKGSIDTATDIVTLTANPGGTSGNSITMADGGTGAVLSGASLSGGAGGNRGYFHVW